MRHVTERGLDRIESLLAKLRDVDALTEKKRGVFYRRSKAFLHFHEDGDDIYADVRLEGSSFDRHRVSTVREQEDLVRRIGRALA